MNESRRSEPVQWLYDLQHFGIKLGLDNIRALLDLHGRPERAYRTAIVGGTNGKGSVAATVAALADAHGRTSGMFTSPHLVHPRERIRIGGCDLSAEDLDRRLIAMRARLEAARREGVLDVQPSFFEVMTAVALDAFRDRGVHTAALEVGLGGRLDATNAVDADVAVVVTVDYDHMKTLGPSIERIAVEKAGIVKPGAPLVTATRRPEALAVLNRVARERRAPLIHALDVTTLHERDDGTCDVATPQARYERLRPSLAGRHQRENLRTALTVFECLASLDGTRPDPDAVRRGVAAVRWPGRLDWRPGPPVTLFDAAHNAEGARLLAEYLGSLDPIPRRGTWLFGAMKGKQFDALLEPLTPFVERVVLTTPGVARAADPDELERAVARHYADARRIDDPAEAFAAARSSVPEDGFLLVAGSLYLVGEILGLERTAEVAGPISM